MNTTLHQHKQIDIVFDMETHDPDDFLTLLLLLGHSEVNLKAVTITPGSPSQIGLVRWTLNEFGLDIPVGAFNRNHPKSCVSSWHERAYGSISPSDDAECGGDVLCATCDDNTTLLTGAPLRNLGVAMERGTFRVGRWVAQGGFAGMGVVPDHKQLPKFKGRITCPTFNFNGDPHAALRAFTYEGIGERWLVSKNVCHGVIYNKEMHAFVEKHKSGSRHLEWIWHGMDVYLKRKRFVRKNEQLRYTSNTVRVREKDGTMLGIIPLEEARKKAVAKGLDLVELDGTSTPPTCQYAIAPDETQIGKKCHDPLAACCAIDPSIAQWEEVSMFRKRGEWGARKQAGTNTHIIVDVDKTRFLDVLVRRSAA